MLSVLQSDEANATTDSPTAARLKLIPVIFPREEEIAEYLHLDQRTQSAPATTSEQASQDEAGKLALATGVLIERHRDYSAAPSTPYQFSASSSLQATKAHKQGTENVTSHLESKCSNAKKRGKLSKLLRVLKGRVAET